MERSVKRSIRAENGHLYISGINTLSLPDTLDCGQAFRWKPADNGRWQGVVGKKVLSVSFAEGTLLLENTSAEEYEKIFKDYFDLGRDYSSIIAAVASDEILVKATKDCAGIRVLKQEPWETLCSFIISQNNNIKRIKGIIERLCETYGDPIGDGFYSFPPAERLAALSAEDLAPLRAGFRAKYIIDAARKVAAKEVDFAAIDKMDYESAQRELMKICGVGQKVADCVLLFGFGKIEAFPKDVWIKRAMEALFPNGLPEKALPYAGIVQQYIFHYARTVGI